MVPLAFERVRQTERALLFESPYAHARITAHEAGWRVLVYLRPEDAAKRGPAAEPGPPRRLKFENGRVRAEGLGPLGLTLEPFSLSFGFLTRLCFFALPRAPWQGFPGLEAALPPAEGHPYSGGLGFTLEEPPHRRYYGLGERTGFLDKKGKRYTFWNTDETKHTEATDRLYQSQPFLLISEGKEALGLALDESFPLVFDLAFSHPGRSRIQTPGPTLDLYLLPGPTPAEVVTRLTALFGRPPLPPRWALGYHQSRYGYQSQEEVRAVAEAFAAHNIPLSALWLDIDYMDGYRVFTFDRYRFPDPKALAKELGRRGIHLVAIVDPGVKKEAGYPVYEEGHARGYFVRTARGEELVGEVWPDPAVWPDFTRPEVREWWGNLHRRLLEAGIAGIWNDMNEPSAFALKNAASDPAWGKTLPLSARHGEKTHLEVHNLYGQCMSRATFEGLSRLAPERRPFVLSRSGFLGIQRYAWVWTGDNQSRWEHLFMSIPMLLNLGLSGVAFAGADIGGFAEDASAELLWRWSWLGAFYPFMRNHSAKTSRRQEPYAFGEPWTGRIAEAIRFRYRLLPYLYTLAAEAAVTGAPLMRPMFWHFPAEAEAYRVNDQFLLGPALLVAPIVRPGEEARAVWLPPGRWQDWWTGEVFEGGRYQVARDHGRIPLFLREGFAVPLAEEGLAFRVFGAKAEGRLYQDAGDGYEPGTWFGLSVKGNRARFEGEARPRVYRREEDGGKPVPLD